MGIMREPISAQGDKRQVRRDEQGRLRETHGLERPLRRHVRNPARHSSPSGQGDGDRKRH
jgi:hypothetical protein